MVNAGDPGSGRDKVRGSLLYSEFNTSLGYYMRLCLKKKKKGGVRERERRGEAGRQWRREGETERAQILVSMLVKFCVLGVLKSTAICPLDKACRSS